MIRFGMNANVFNIIVYDELPNATRLAMRAMRMRIGYMSTCQWAVIFFLNLRNRHSEAIGVQRLFSSAAAVSGVRFFLQPSFLVYEPFLYLLATKDFKIKGVYSPKLDIRLPYSDSDWAGDMPITTCSHSGTMITLNDTPIRWRSKKQPKTSRSCAEAETYALSETVGETRHLGWKMREFGMKVDEPYTMYVDNEQCISFTKNITVNSRLRTTFNLKDKWIKELRDDKIVQVKHVSGIRNPADILTKALPAYKHKVILNIIQHIRTPQDTNSDTNPDPNPNPNPEDDDSDTDPDPSSNPNPNQNHNLNPDQTNTSFHSNLSHTNTNP